MRVKKTLQPLVENNYIFFGIGNKSIERKISNTEENINLVKKLEQSTDILELKEEETVLLNNFINKGLVTTNDYDKTYRYSRNINFFEWINISSNLDPVYYQNQISNSKIMIVGLGGIGGTLSEILVRLGVGKLILVDFDIVEKSNITRQSTYTESSIGFEKLEECSKYLKKINKELIIDTVKMKIEKKEDLEEIYQKYDFDLAVCCADKPKIKIDYWFDDVSHKFNKKFIIGSYASTVINYACIVPGITKSLKDFYGENMITDDKIFEFNDSGIIAPISYMAAGLIANKVFQEITGLNNKNEAVQIDVLDWTVATYEMV